MRYIFEEWTLDTEQYVLYRADFVIPLQPKVFQVLQYLLEHRDRVIAKQELSEQLWPDQFISDATIESTIKAIRRAVGDDGRTQWCIQTRRGQGYRFVAILKESTEASPDTERMAQGSPPSSQAASPQASKFPTQDNPGVSRRQLTVMFCDLVGSTALSGQFDPEDLRDLMQAYYEACAEVVHHYDGYIAQYLGDGLLVYFGYPQAHEDDAHRAVRAGLEFLGALGPLNARVKDTHGIQLAARVGIYTGLVVVGGDRQDESQERLAFGEAPNLAAHLQHLASPNQVVLSEETRRLAGGAFAYEALGARTLKGLQTPLPVYRVVREYPGAGRFDVTAGPALTALVGREEELALLLRRWEQAKAGEGQAVLISGEVGIGKSRLAHTLHERINDQPHHLVHYQCSPYHRNSPFYPLMAQLEGAVQMTRTDTATDKLIKLETYFVETAKVLDEVVPLVADLLQVPIRDRYPMLTLTPQKQRAKTITVLADELVRRAQEQPLLVMVEDVHWSDPTTLEVFQEVMYRSLRLPVLIVFTARPEFDVPKQLESQVSVLALNRLSQAQTATMITALTERNHLSAVTRDAIMAKTDGIPLFIEEVTKAADETGMLNVDVEPGRVIRSISREIPLTIQGLLLAQLDQLGSIKEVAQLGAALGREFTYQLLSAVSGWNETDLQDALDQLVHSGLLFRYGHPPESGYRFKHAMIRDVAYGSQLKRQQRQCHKRIAQVLAEQFPEMAEMQPELLAYHYSEAGLEANALPFWQQAGARAMARSAYHEAATCLEQALLALQKQPSTRDNLAQAIDLRLDLRSALGPLGAWARLVDIMHEAERLAKTLNDRYRLGLIASLMTNLFRSLGDLDQAQAEGQRASATATALGDRVLQIVANNNMGVVYYFMGQFQQAREVLESNLRNISGKERYERFGQREIPAVWSRVWLTMVHTQMGEFDQGRLLGAEAIQIADRVNHPYSSMLTDYGMGFLALRQGDFSQAIATLERGLAVCREEYIESWIPAFTANLGYAYLFTERLDETLPLLEQAMTLDLTLRSGTPSPTWVTYLCMAYLQADRQAEALPLALQALTVAHDSNARGSEAAVLRCLGTLSVHANPPDTALAETYYQQALDIANELGMRPLQSHCHRNLGALYVLTGREKQARVALSTAIEMYGDMMMTFWLPKTEAALTEISE